MSETIFVDRTDVHKTDSILIESVRDLSKQQPSFFTIIPACLPAKTILPRRAQV